MRLFRKKIKSDETKKIVLKKDLSIKCALFVIGAFISALSFNLFYMPNNLVAGGLGGVAIIINHFIPVNADLVILIGNLIFITISICMIGWKNTILGAVGASVYTIFVYLTANIAVDINFSFDNILLYVLAAGIVSGFGEALVYKAGFNTGGNSIIAQIICEKTKMPLGKVLRIISFIIIFSGGFAFGYTGIMYSLIITVISSAIVDKILIGISDSKTFFIMTSKEDEVKDFIINEIISGVTEIGTRGSFTHKKQDMLMCVVPTEKYTLLKTAIEEIDPSAFIVVSDCYEVYGGTKRKKLTIE